MRQYIVNLTNHLITKNRYHSDSLHGGKLREYVALHLWINDVADMRPEKLGEIMCAFETGDVMATKEELFALVHFTGDCGDMLREFVAACLAYVIVDQLNRSGNQLELL